MSAEENLQRMKTLDDAWNAQDWAVFKKRHSHDTTVHWPGQPDPTRGSKPTRPSPNNSSNQSKTISKTIRTG